jgi:CRP-like cAMP-binding protein
MIKADSPKTNALLGALPASAYRRLLPHLQAASLAVDETLFSPGSPMRYVYFPTTSIVTLAYAVEADGRMAKAWPVGREGVVGIALLMGSSRRDNRANVQIAGLAYRLPASAVIAEFRRAEAFHGLLLRYVFALVTQASQLGVCSHYHPVEQRLCRFLLRLFDRVSAPEVTITHERIAALLGVRRTSITLAAGALQAAGFIEYRRGQIRVVNERGLAERSCACTAIIRRAFAEVTA